MIIEKKLNYIYSLLKKISLEFMINESCYLFFFFFKGILLIG